MDKHYQEDASIALTPPDHLLNYILLDFQVEVGRTKIKISEAMHLKPGSILALDQLADDPLVIYLNDKPIAKGQIISSKGQYHIRIV